MQRGEAAAVKTVGRRAEELQAGAQRQWRASSDERNDNEEAYTVVPACASSAEDGSEQEVWRDEPRCEMQRKQAGVRAPRGGTEVAAEAVWREVAAA